jgi:hypothetical protein
VAWPRNQGKRTLAKAQGKCKWNEGTVAVIWVRNGMAWKNGSRGDVLNEAESSGLNEVKMVTCVN